MSSFYLPARRGLLASKLWFPLLAKSFDAFAVIFRFHEHALCKRLEHSPRLEIAVNRMPQHSLRESQSFGRASQQMFGQFASLVKQFVVWNNACYQPDSPGFISGYHLSAKDQILGPTVANQFYQPRA